MKKLLMFYMIIAFAACNHPTVPPANTSEPTPTATQAAEDQHVNTETPTQVSTPVVKPTPATTPVVKPTPATTPVVKPTPVLTPTPSLDDIKLIAAQSQCLKYNWKDRGHASHVYIKGMSLVFARAVCNISLPSNQIVAQAKTGNEVKDSLTWYDPEFKALNMPNDHTGVDTMRHAYTLLIGLGMRESSGRYCCGRDMSANFSSADSAEAGTFQASYGSRRSSNELNNLYAKYKANPVGCFSPIFKYQVSCSESNLKNWGEGEGFNWQKLTKDCPAFGAEWAAILIRTTGGTKGEFGPLRKKAAEIRPECDSMLKQIQDLVEKNPKLCEQLNSFRE